MTYIAKPALHHPTLACNALGLTRRDYEGKISTLCAGCGQCADVCQFAAISVDDGLARIDAAACMGCGVCVAHCPQEAITLVRDPAKGEPLEIQKLIAEAARAA